MPVGVGCHRGFYIGWPSWDASRCSVAPGRWHASTLTSLWLLAWSFARHRPHWLPRKQLACTAIVFLFGMPGRPVVTSSGHSRYGAPGTLRVYGERNSAAWGPGGVVGYRVPHPSLNPTNRQPSTIQDTRPA